MVGYLRWVSIAGWFKWLVMTQQDQLFCFFREYWGGFFPILLVELTDGEDEVAAIEQRTVG